MVPASVRSTKTLTSSTSKRRFWLTPEMINRILFTRRDLIAKYPDSVIMFMPDGSVVFAKKGMYGGWLVKDSSILGDKKRKESFIEAVNNGLVVAVIPQLESKYGNADVGELFKYLRKKLGDDVVKVIEPLVRYSGSVEKKIVNGEIYIARPKIKQIDKRYIVIDFVDAIGPIKVKTTGVYYVFNVPSIKNASSKVIASSYYKRILSKAEKQGIPEEDVKRVIENLGSSYRVVDNPVELEVPDDVADLLGLNENTEIKDKVEEEDFDIDELAEEFGLEPTKKTKPKPKKKAKEVPTAVGTKKGETRPAPEEEEEEIVEEVKKRVPSKEEIAKKVEDFIRREGLLKARVIVFDLPTEYRGAKVITKKDKNKKVVEEVRVFKTDPSVYRRMRVDFYNVLHRVAWRAKVGWVMYQGVPLMADDIEKLRRLMIGLNQLAGTRRAVEVIDIFLPKDYVVAELKAYIRRQADLAKQIRERLMTEELKKSVAKRLKRQLKEVETELKMLKKELEELLKA